MVSIGLPAILMIQSIHQNAAVLLSPDHTYGDRHDVRAWLYVKLTSYPLSHDPRDSIGCVGHSETGPLDFTRGGVTVTVVFLH